LVLSSIVFWFVPRFFSLFIPMALMCLVMLTSFLFRPD